MEQKITYELLCEYAEKLGFNHRPPEENSRAKDLTHTYYQMPWNKEQIMVLYEGERRIVRGHDKPEVCWVCINDMGDILSIPSRTIRMMSRLPGFALGQHAANKILCIIENEECDIYDYFMTYIYKKED